MLAPGELAGAVATMGPWGRRRVAGSRQRRRRRLLVGEALAGAAATTGPGGKKEIAVAKEQGPAAEEEQGCRETLGWAPVRWEGWSGEESAGRCPWERGEDRPLVRWVP